MVMKGRTLPNPLSPCFVVDKNVQHLVTKFQDVLGTLQGLRNLTKSMFLIAPPEDLLLYCQA